MYESRMEEMIIMNEKEKNGKCILVHLDRQKMLGMIEFDGYDRIRPLDIENMNRNELIWCQSVDGELYMLE